MRGRMLALEPEGPEQASNLGAEEICPDELDLEGQQAVLAHHG